MSYLHPYIVRIFREIYSDYQSILQAEKFCRKEDQYQLMKCHDIRFYFSMVDLEPQYASLLYIYLFGTTHLLFFVRNVCFFPYVDTS